MTNQLRATTNLVVPKHLQIPRAEMKKGFMYVYGGNYVGLEPIFMQRLWLSSVFPEITNDPSFGKDRAGIRKFAQYKEKFQKAGLIRLKKVNDEANPHFVVAVPLAEFDRYDVSMFVLRLRMWFTNGKHESPDDKVAALSDELKNTAEDQEMQQRLITPEHAIKAANFDSRATMELKECLLGLRLQYTGGTAVIFADFKITKAEAQQLTSTEWMLIRNVDLYPLLLQWQVSLWGYKGNAPTSSFPMSKISKTLPPFHKGTSRVNEFGLSISADGAPMWLPETLDATTRYEDLYSQIGDKGDDTFGLIDVPDAGAAAASGEELKVRLPKNIPVLIDWVNNRFAYTQGNGVLKVQDLSRFKICNAAHARNLLTNWSIQENDIEAIVRMGQVAGVADALFFTEDEMADINENDSVIASRLGSSGGIRFEDYWPLALSYHERFVNEVSIKLREISTEGDPIWRPLARFIDQAQSAVLSHMDAVNQKFTVSGTVSRLGLMTLIAKYGNDYSNTVAKANTICAAAANQNVDPNWKPPSVPMIMDNPERPFSLLPHQVKVRNLMKDSPDFAILPIQAGGGKTPLAIIDVLMEIQNNRSNPYLIMCPSPLVAQYVKEVTYFTAGKINVIPIVSESLAKHGFERITAMIQSAPRNSVVVVNYDVLRSKAYDVCYGTTNVKIYPVIELLRQFNFGYALLDESHFMKNDSQRTRAAMVLIADIPKKRLASGTMAHDSPSDLALQVAMLDPTLFGSRDEFNERFGAKVNGNRVIEWKAGAQTQIMSMIKSRIVVAKAMRKEWAALLPTADEKMYRVDMSDAQREVYDAILTEELGKLKEEAMKGNNKALKKFFENQPLQIENPQPGGDQGRNEEEDEEAEDVADESAGEELEGLLGFALARLEQYMTAPGRDELGARVLKGDDLRSPKVNMILKLVEEHIASGRPGKVLVFTNYIESAEEIFASASPTLQKQGILYTAANKVEDGAQFETNAAKKWMVGVENSMNTGLNFQFVSHLIRVENVWNPGTLEQGNARINRPEMKKADQRPTIYYSWIITNNSIDVTKVSRLISKMIAVAKFENTDNERYENVPDVPVIPMSAEAIMLRNSWTDLAEYAQAFGQLNQARFDDYAEYREKHGALVLSPLHEAPLPRDAAIMAEVPYVAGLEVFSGANQGLVRVDEYLRLNSVEDGGGDDDAEGDEADAKTAEQKRKMELAESLKGQPIHTEFGDGICRSVAFSSKMLTVALSSGYQVKIRFASAFVITKKAQKGKIVRQQILKAISDKMPIVAPTGVLANRMKIDNKAVRQAELQKQEEEIEETKQQVKRDVEAALNVELQFSISNGFLGIAYYPEDDGDASAALQALGFRPVEPYVFAEVRNEQHLIKQFNAWHAAGFQFEKQFQKTGAVDAIKDLAKVLKMGGLKSGTMSYRYSSRNQLQNFFKMELKPSADPKSFKPYPMIEDGRAYIVMHTRGQPGAIQAMKIKSPGIRWQHSPKCMIFYGLSVDKISAKMKQILQGGIQVSNLKDLQQEFKALKNRKIRNEE